MWAFKDKGERDVCLIPEATGVIQELYRQEWEKTLPKPIRLFYISRCYRYERPQLGRYREFTQVGVEILGPDASGEEAVALLKSCLDAFGLSYRFVPAVKRGLTYYLEDGFEVECDQLGAETSGRGRSVCGRHWLGHWAGSALAGLGLTYSPSRAFVCLLRRLPGEFGQFIW